MNRRAFVTGLGAVLAAPLAADAQHTGKVYHVGWLRYMPCQERGPSGDLLQQGLRERGYVEGRDVVIECRSAAAGREHLSDFATELVAGVRAVQSTPLWTHRGDFVGMLSTHYRRAGRPTGPDLHVLDVLGHLTADYIERARTEPEAEAGRGRSP